ncbi:MAG: hydrolase [Pseudazoarcus pumilus]|nr:hydrolase [Pseudazoarcus pumilus]
MPIHLQTPWWLSGAHLETVYPLLRKPLALAMQRERLETPDGDFIDCDWLAGGPPDAPLVVLFHGLEGSSHSHYARSLMHAVAARGWRGVIPHFRGCSGEANRLARAYHSGDSGEIGWIITQLSVRAGGSPLLVAGVSLGGNALLKWLGEQEQAATRQVAAAMAICPPLDLSVSGHALARGFNRIYTRHFLATLKPKALAKLERFPGLFERERLLAARTLYDFDDVYTGPVHGYAGADDYWRRASARPWLRRIAVPTLLLTAANDPFVPAAALPSVTECSATLQHHHTQTGGHVGFVTGPFPGSLDWLGICAIDYFSRRV